MNTDNLYIGIAGFARSGKDSLAKALRLALGKRGIISVRVALADDLKRDIKDFIYSKLGIDVFTASGKDKELIRPLLVEYGRAKRIQTNGKYWTSRLDSIVDATDIPDGSAVIIPDIRYAEYQEDELGWLTSKKRYLFIHIQREGIQPPNKDEEANNDTLRAKAFELPFGIPLSFPSKDPDQPEEDWMKEYEFVSEQILNEFLV